MTDYLMAKFLESVMRMKQMTNVEEIIKCENDPTIKFMYSYLNILLGADINKVNVFDVERVSSTIKRIQNVLLEDLAKEIKAR